MLFLVLCPLPEHLLLPVLKTILGKKVFGLTWWSQTSFCVVRKHPVKGGLNFQYNTVRQSSFAALCSCQCLQAAARCQMIPSNFA